MFLSIFLSIIIIITHFDKIFNARTVNNMELQIITLKGGVSTLTDPSLLLKTVRVDTRGRIKQSTYAKQSID